jgi:hypothetical protein
LLHARIFALAVTDGPVTIVGGDARAANQFFVLCISTGGDAQCAETVE